MADFDPRAFALALARANKHPDPDSYAARVMESLETGGAPAEDQADEPPEVELAPSV